MNKIAIFLVAGLAALLTVFNNGTNANAANSTNNAANTSQIQETMVLGKLYFVNVKEGEKPIMTALSLFGNRCGSESFNHKPYAAEGIRSVFELDEWIEFYPQASAGSGIKVMVFKHQEDQGFYLKSSLNDKTPGYIQELDLNKDPEGDETSLWGSFYLHPEEVEPGYYDFVFIYKNKVFATMLTHFFKPNEIYEKSDSELEKLMSQSL
ncbi:MAG: hypothetical protein IJL29_11055 [Prevotella sp.]|nr:hypothetical protein [Prevotella sp.]MBQ6033536.1 hypothetical protein [Prevotella sp.]MBQ6308226.1 hypothetical protein [Prevotella sp.]MBQ9569974.1 hypothetical protein [Prevotella sp.]